LQLDAWLFSIFLNVLLGSPARSDGLTRVDLSEGSRRRRLSGYGLARHPTTTATSTAWENVAVGLANERFFASLTGTLDAENLSAPSSPTPRALIRSAPRVSESMDGAHLGLGWRDLPGRPGRSHQGHPHASVVGGVGFDVQLKDRDPWNIQPGMETARSEHWHVPTPKAASPASSPPSWGATYRF
jgi:hypothetical protein